MYAMLLYVSFAVLDQRQSASQVSVISDLALLPKDASLNSQVEQGFLQLHKRLPPRVPQ